jgi:hypothetical protein
METEHASHSKIVPLAIRADMFDDRGEAGFEVVEPVGDLAQSLIEGVQAGLDGVSVLADGFVWLRRCTAGQHGVEVLWVPAEGDGQGLQGSRAAASFDGVVLEFADDRLGHVGAFREFALAPAERVHSLVDGLGDCRPVFRHPFLRAPPQRRD